MSVLNSKKYSKLSAIGIRAARCFLLPALFIVLSLNGNAHAQEEGQEVNAEQKDVSNGKIVNSYGHEMGSIDANGNVTNISGTFLGSVDSDGNIFNVSKINIGKVTKEGNVLNQSDTLLGSVNANGEIFNVSGAKLGEVKGENNLNRLGGIARLIFFKKNK